MEQERPKGRGLEEVAHFFFSAKAGQVREEAPAPEVSPVAVIALVSLVEDLPASFLTANLALELSYRQLKVLAADTAHEMFNIFFAMGMDRAFTPIEDFLTGQNREIVVTGPRGIRILTFPLDSGRMSLLRSLPPGGLFRALIREEQKNNILLVNTHPFSSSFAQTAAQIFPEAFEIVILTPSDFQGLRSSYSFIKSLFRQNQGSRVGVILYHSKSEISPEERYGLLADATAKFLGRKIRGYGHLMHDQQLYLSVIQGRPLCRMTERSENASVFSEMSKKILAQVIKGNPLVDLIRTSDRRPLLEMLSTRTSVPGSRFIPASLSRDEERFLARPMIA